MSAVIAIANMKGGVGKTTTTIALGETLATQGAEVLIVDLDAQGNTSFSIAGPRILQNLSETGRTIENYLNARLLERKSRRISDIVRRSVSSVLHEDEQLSLSLICATPNLRHVEQKMIVQLTKAGVSWEEIEGEIRKILARDITTLRKRFDYILFDCAPGISAATEAAIKLADLMIMPTIPDFVSTQGVPAFIDSIFGEPEDNQKPWVLFTRVKARSRHQRTYKSLLRENAETPTGTYRVFQVEMPEMVHVPEAMSQSVTFTNTGRMSYDAKWRDFAKPLHALSEEVRRILSNGCGFQPDGNLQAYGG